MKKVKISFILPDTNVGGAETVCINLINALDLCKYDPVLVIIRDTGNLLDRLNIDVPVIDLGCKSTKDAVLSLAKKLREIKPQIAFTTHSRTAFVLSFLRFFTPKFFQISRMQSSPQAEKEHRVYGAIHRALYSWAFKKADLVVAQTEEMKLEAAEVFGLKGKSIIVANNPIRSEVQNYRQSEQLSSQLVLDQNFYNIVAAGRLDVVKDYGTLIRAFFESKDFIPKAKLYILGRDGTDAENIRELIKSLELENEVCLLGHLPDPTPFFLQSDLFVLSSIYEGCPNVLLENYILNTPLVATRCCGVVRRLIKEGVNGFTSEIKNVSELSEAIRKSYYELNRLNIANEWNASKSLDNFFNQNLQL